MSSIFESAGKSNCFVWFKTHAFRYLSIFCSYTNCKLVFVDIDPHTFNIDLKLLEKAISKKTKAIIPVHLFGQTVDIPHIREIVTGKKIAIIEDCAQAFGAQIKDRKVGTFGDFGCFSFFPSKNLGAYGDGGLIILIIANILKISQC